MARKKKLLAVASEPHTLVLYESTHRILDCLADVHETLGSECLLVLAKELTKSHERFVEGTAKELMAWIESDPGHVKGEFVLIIPPRPEVDVQQHDERLLKVLLRELPLKQAVSIASQLVDTHKNELYEMALRLKEAACR